MANCKVNRNTSLNGIEIKFPAAPGAAIIQQLKAKGFRWSSRNAVWYAKFSERLLQFASELCEGNLDVSAPATEKHPAEKVPFPYHENRFYIPDFGPYAGSFSIPESERVKAENLKEGDKVLLAEDGYPLFGIVKNVEAATMTFTPVFGPSSMKEESTYYAKTITSLDGSYTFPRLSAMRLATPEDFDNPEFDKYQSFVPSFNKITTPYKAWAALQLTARFIVKNPEEVRRQMCAEWAEWEEKNKAYALEITGETADGYEYRRMGWTRYKSANIQKSMQLLQRRIEANPHKWQIGDGVGIKLGVGKTGRYGNSQINRGYAIYDLDIDSKRALVKQVKDTGLATTNYVSTQGSYLAGAEWVDMGDLVRDRDYDLSNDAIERIKQKKNNMAAPTAPVATVPTIDAQLLETVSQYGWTVAINDQGEMELFNRNGKKVGNIYQKQSKYKITDESGTKLLDGNANLAKSVERVMTDYWYATKLKVMPVTTATTESAKLTLPETFATVITQKSASPFSGQYFLDNPGKVLGKIVTHNPNTGRELTDAFGKPRPEVQGTLEDAISRLSHIRNAMRFEHVKPDETPTAMQPAALVQKQVELTTKITQIVQATKEQNNEQSKRGGACEDGLECLGETILKHNQKVEYKTPDEQTAYYTISPEEITVWVTYQVLQGVYDKATIKNNDWKDYFIENPSKDQWLSWWEQELVAYNGQEWVPESLYYSGNIYRNLRILEDNKAAIVAMIGEGGYDLQVNKMQAAKPKQLLITLDETKRLYLSPFDKIWDDVKITQIENGLTARDGEEYHVHSFFQNWINQLPKDDFVFERKQTNARDVYSYWIEKARFPRDTYSDSEKAAIRRNTTIIGQLLFDRFMVEQLTEQDKAKIAGLWNSLRNNYVDIAYHRIPVGFSVNRSFKGGKLAIRPAQREGVAFMGGRGRGIVAFDVGVGKTLTAILGIMDGMEKGLFKRPMIVVPQKVYHKWIAEISGIKAEKAMTINGKNIKAGQIISEGILPQLKVNDYYNLGGKYLGKATEGSITLTVEEYSITIVTYEGLELIGFTEEIENKLSQRLAEALSQGESGRSKAIIEGQADTWIDTALKDTKVTIDEMGIDAIIVDEAHNFRNLFMEVRGDISAEGERDQKNFFSGGSASPSNRAVKLFMLNAYVHDQKQLRNTFGLTATPFTNRATEIYSMLSLYDYHGMKDFDVYNLAQFCSTFIDETLEDAWTAAGKFDIKAVIRGYNNLPILQALVRRSVNYKTGEDANIHRPEKVILPLKTDEKGIPLAFEHIVDTVLPASPLQMEWLKAAAQFAGGENDRENPIAQAYPPNNKGKIDGRTLIAMNIARMATFSPYAVKYGVVSVGYPGEISAEEFVKNSPKILYACECIRSVKEHHEKNKTPISGQIIYSDRGKEWFPSIKEYLVKNVGFSDKEVAEFHAGISADRREKIKEAFLEGEIKVIIGTSTMREGVDLQKNGSVIYVCYLDWNPTDLHQLMGRIWRFGNKYGFVRIVVPLVENSSDIFTWQKLSEKMARLNSVWTKADGTKAFEEAELNAEELKKGLINDPEAIVKYEVQQEKEFLQSELALTVASLEQLNEVNTKRDEYYATLQKMEKWLEEARTNPQVDAYSYDDKVEKLKKVTEILQKYEAEPDKEKALMAFTRAYANLVSYNSYTISATLDAFRKQREKLKLVQDRILSRYKLTVFDDFLPVVEEYTTRKEKLQADIFAVSSDEEFQRRLAIVQAQKEAEKANSRNVSQRVTEFSRLNYLLNCLDGIHTCDIYGRVTEIKSGEVVEVDTKVQANIAEPFTFGEKLSKFMPKIQQRVVSRIILENAEPGYADNVLAPLKVQVESIPELYATETVPLDEKIIYAHFFIQDSDWYIAEWDGKDKLFGYSILGGDHQNAEWGYISMQEINAARGRMGNGVELDFYWTPVPFSKIKKAQVEEEEEDAADNDLQDAINSLQLALEFAEGDDKISLASAIEALQTALEFA